MVPQTPTLEGTRPKGYLTFKAIRQVEGERVTYAHRAGDDHGRRDRGAGLDATESRFHTTEPAEAAHLVGVEPDRRNGALGADPPGHRRRQALRRAHRPEQCERWTQKRQAPF